MSLEALCRLFGISRQAWYKQAKVYTRHQQEDIIIHDAVSVVRSRQPRIGGRKLHHLLEPILQAHNISMGRDKLFKWLYNNNLLIRKRKRRGPKTTDSSAWRNQYPDLVKGLEVEYLNQVWVSDITYLKVNENFVYLALITDVYSRMVVGFHLAGSLETKLLCIPALQMAFERVPASLRTGLIHHSDRGNQYLSEAYCKVLAPEDVKISMTQDGNPKDNAIAERLNGILKQEFLPEVFTDFNQAQSLVESAVLIYNSERPHTSLAYKKPAEQYEENIKNRLTLPQPPNDGRRAL